MIGLIALRLISLVTSQAILHADRVNQFTVGAQNGYCSQMHCTLLAAIKQAVPSSHGAPSAPISTAIIEYPNSFHQEIRHVQTSTRTHRRFRIVFSCY